MDHVWDGFYTGQLRLSRFPGVVQAEKTSIYDLVYTGTPAKTQKFLLKSQDSRAAMTVRIAYPSAMSRSILKDGQLIDMNQWDEGIRMYGEIRRRYCGENRYIGVKNILEFYITAGCTLQIQPRDAIQTLVRMEWTLAEFFADGGTTKFVDRLAGALGIHASTIKVVSVYQGSVVLNYAITVADDDQTKLDAIQATQTRLYATGQLDLGAPILDVTTGNNDAVNTKIVANGVVTASGYDPIIITKTSSSTGGSASSFVPDIPILDQNQTFYKNVIKRKEGQQKEQQAITQRIENALEGKDSSAAVIIIMTLAALFLVCIVVAIRYAINQSKKDLLDVQNVATRRAEDLKAKQELDAVQITEQGLMATASGDKMLEQRDSHLSLKVVAKTAQPAAENYEEQYDPNQDFAVFGMGDKTQGGLQSLAEKMNLADRDALDDADSSDSAAEDGAPRSTTNTSSSKAASPPLPDIDTAPQAAAIVGTPVQNNLPEDQEFVDEQEED